MSPIDLHLDPENPAQFFACCGVLELAAIFSEPNGHGVEAVFEYDRRQPRRALFRLYHSAKPLTELIAILKAAKATAPEQSGEAPVTLRLADAVDMTLDWWLEPDRSRKSRLKLWAGQQTSLTLVTTMLAALPDEADANLFLANKVPMSGRFGLDPRSAWNTLDFGSSVNEQGRDAYTFPAAETLAAIGLQGFRPQSGESRTSYSYRIWSTLLPPVVARAAVQAAIPIPGQGFVFSIEKRSGAYSCFAYAQPTQGA